MICSRTFKTYGPYGLRPHGEPRKAKLFRVVDAQGRRITEPMRHADARRLCTLLNDVFETALTARISLTFER